MSLKVSTMTTYSGVLAATDFLYLLRSGQPAGQRDRKFAANALVTLTDAQTLTNKTLTAPAITGGSVNNTPIGATTPNTGAFTTLSATGAATLQSTLAVTGVTTPTGGTAAAGGFSNPTCWHSGNAAPDTTTTGTDTTPVITETYISEVFIPVNCTLTGVSVLLGSANAGNIHVGLADSTGAKVAESASVAAAATNAYQQVPFTGSYAAKGPAKYYILLQNSNAANRYRSHILGNFGASKKTGDTYGTFTSITPPTTFTTNLGAIADVY